MALKFLLDTTDETTVISRIVGKYALYYEPLGKGYEELFYYTWDNIRCKEVMKLGFKALEEQDDEKGKMDAMRRYAELTAALSDGRNGTCK